MKISSVKIARGSLFFVPSLEITFEVTNNLDVDARLDRIVYTIQIQVDDWVPTLGSETYLESAIIPKGSTVPFTHQFFLDYEAVRQIDDRMKDIHDNISWRIRTKTFIESPSGSDPLELSGDHVGDANAQKDPWTPYSTWKRWVETWQVHARPKPYEYLEKIGELETRLRTMIEQAKTGMRISLSEKTEQLLTSVVEEIRNAVSPKRLEFEFLTTEPRGTDNNPLNKCVERMITDSAKSLEIVSLRIDKYYGEIKKARAKGVELRIMVQPTSQAKGERKKFKKAAIMDLKEVAKVKETPILHSRMIISDKKTVLLTTADITQDGLIDQFNYGIYSSNPRLVSESLKYFEEVWR